MTPAAMVDMMGVFLSLTRARNEKSRPSRAMAKIIRGRGNMEPSRLGSNKEEEEGGRNEGTRMGRQVQNKRKSMKRKQNKQRGKGGKNRGKVQ